MKDHFAVVVLGMHRSGTSALTGALGILGVDLGHEMRAPHEGVNAKGYWEHLGILRVHERLLDHLRSSWDDVRPLPDLWWKNPSVAPFRDEIVEILRRDFDQAPVWGVKDPRTCRLVPLWLDVFAELGCRYGFVHTMRHPAEVARSLAKRDGFQDEKSTLLWVENNLAAEKATRGHPRLFLGFDELLQDSLPTLSRIETELDMRFPNSIESVSGELRDFLTPKLRHFEARASEGGSREKNAELTSRLVKALNDSKFKETETTRQLWDDVRSDYAKLVASYEPAVQSHLGDLQEQVASLRKRLDRVESSTSWRATRPLRKAGRFVMRVFHRDRSRPRIPQAHSAH